MGLFNRRKQQQPKSNTPLFDALTDPNVSTTECRHLVNAELAKRGLPQYQDDDEFLYDILKGNRTDEEFAADLDRAEQAFRRAEQLSRRTQ